MAHLSAEQKQFFKENGYLIVRQVLDRRDMDEALDRLWNAMNDVDRNEPATWLDKGYRVVRDVGNSDPVKRMVNESPVFAIAEEMVGEGALVRGAGAGPHIAFPRSDGRWSPPGGHLDGYYTPTNGVTKGTVGGFTVAVTMYLNDVKPHAGCFTFYPGSHRICAEYFRTHPLDGPQGGVMAFPMGEPTEFVGDAGDVCFWHYWMYHTASANAGKEPRIAFITRLRRKDVNQTKFDLYDGDLWKYWEGLR